MVSVKNGKNGRNRNEKSEENRKKEISPWCCIFLHESPEILFWLAGVVLKISAELVGRSRWVFLLRSSTWAFAVPVILPRICYNHAEMSRDKILTCASQQLVVKMRRKFKALQPGWVLFVHVNIHVDTCGYCHFP